MIPLYSLIAVVAITGPDSEEPPACPLYSLQAAALSLELLDPRELQWYFVRPDCLCGDLTAMRARYDELRDCPPLCDHVRFPCEQTCRAMRDWNLDYEEWLRERLRFHPNEEWIADALDECKELYRLWDYALDAQKDYYVYWRRRCLQHMREIVGDNAYYASCLPAPVPVWRYWRVE